MAKVKIEGGHPLHGTVRVSGAKNAALPLLAATVLFDGETLLTNVPNLSDVTTMVRMLRSINIIAEQHNNQIRIVNRKDIKHVIPYELVTKMRASFFIAGPILARTGMVRIPMPGGCAIGSRPVDIHLKGFQALGATVKLEHGFIEIKATKLIGNTVAFSFPSVGATENIMMAASLAEGDTTITNAACEPEIVDLATMLNAAGAKITGAGTATIKITGVKSLKGISHPVIPDRIEAGTFILAGLITGADLTVSHMNVEHQAALLASIRDTGAVVEIIDEQTVRTLPNQKWKAADITTQPFPGFPTDMQAQMMTFLCLAEGTSMVKEHIFENRFMHCGELSRMGAQIKIDDRTAVITGVAKLSGTEVQATDLRAGAALWLAGLVAEGETIIYDIEHVERGYDKLTEKLANVGAVIKRLS